MLMGPDRCANELGRLLDAQKEAAAGLLALLTDERDALKRGDSEGLEQIAGGKAQQIQRLQELEAEQRRLLDGLALSEDPASALDRALDWCDPGGELRRKHVETMQTVIECKRDNQRNGVMVRHRLGYLRRALQVLRSAHAETMTYGPDGETEGDGQSRLLAEG